MNQLDASVFQLRVPSRTTLLDLVRLCRSDPTCARLLHFLYDHPTTLMTSPDIAFHLNVAIKDIDAAIERLLSKGLLRRMVLDGCTFFGLTDEEGALEVVRQFESWCATVRHRWQSKYAPIL